jgi:hypothetical protein
MVMLGEPALSYVIHQYLAYYHAESATIKASPTNS